MPHAFCSTSSDLLLDDSEDPLHISFHNPERSTKPDLPIDCSQCILPMSGRGLTTTITPSKSPTTLHHIRESKAPCASTTTTSRLQRVEPSQQLAERKGAEPERQLAQSVAEEDSKADSKDKHINDDDPDGGCNWDDDDFEVVLVHPAAAAAAADAAASTEDTDRAATMTAVSDTTAKGGDWLTDAMDVRVAVNQVLADKESSRQAIASLNTPADKKKPRCGVCTRPLTIVVEGQIERVCPKCG